MKHSYKNKNEVILLLTDVTGRVKPVSIEERGKIITSGGKARSVIIHEYEVSEKYREIVHRHMDNYIGDMARYTGILAERLYEAKGSSLVLVDIVRAGIPIGILVKRYLKKYYNADIPHYGISLVEGLDPKAMEYIISRHGRSGIQFIDGWTGKGTVAKEILKSCMDYDGVDASLAVLSDCTGFAKYAGTREDVYIPHSPLNAAVTGLVSITVKNPEYSGKNGFHAAMYLKNMEQYDESEQFVDAVSAWFSKQMPEEIKPDGWGIPYMMMGEGINKIAVETGNDRSLLNPGINEAARAVLRRDLDSLLVYDKNDYDLIPLMELAESKGIRIIEYKKLYGYKAVSVAKDGYIR